MANNVIVSGRVKRLRVEERKNGKSYYELSFVLVNSRKVGEKWMNVRISVKYFSYRKPNLENGMRITVIGELRNDSDTMSLLVRANQIFVEIESPEEEVKEAEEKFETDNEEMEEKEEIEEI